ncbi:MAG: FHA domain-containing protein [Lentimicrobiaceae bacterium]|nr:FHA domain-containing protein [Lentimicrobiaceae bacterium]
MKVITIGRSSENNIVINDAKVSRTHLQLIQNDNGVCSVVDLNSANGTFVNGQKISEEVRLQPRDVIRIGNTILPWQEYIKPSMAIGQKLTDNVRPTPRSKKIWWYVTACVVLSLFAGGIGFYYYYNEKEQEKIEEIKRRQEEIRKEQLYQQKTAEAKRLQDEADELFRQALISQSDKSKALAEAKQKEATEAKKQADAAVADAQRKDKIATEERNARKAAEKAEKEARQKAESDAKAAETALAEKDKEIELTKGFYAEYAVMKSDFAKQVYGQLPKELPKSKDAKEALKDLFNKSDNKGKQEIVEAIQVVKQQNSKMKGNESEIKSDSLSL